MGKQKRYEDVLEGQLAKIIGGSAQALMQQTLARQSSPPLQDFGQTDGHSLGQTDGQTDRRTNTPEPPVDPNGSTRMIQEDSPYGSTERTIPLVEPGYTNHTRLVQPNGSPTFNQMDEPFTGRTRHEKNLLRYISRHGTVAVRIKILAEKLDIPPPSLYKIIPRLCRLGLLGKEDQGNDGLRLWVNQMVQPGSTKRVNQMDYAGSTERMNHSASKIDREKDLSSSWTEELIMTMWPAVATAGFGRKQLEQIEEMRTQLGLPALPPGELTVSLDRADWELAEKGCLTDLKTGSTVKNPAAYLFTALAKFGAFRAHHEYVNRAEALAKGIADELKRKEEAAFTTWVAGLEPGERKKILETKPGGPEEPWLKMHWAKHVKGS